MNSFRFVHFVVSMITLARNPSLSRMIISATRCKPLQPLDKRLCYQPDSTMILGLILKKILWRFKR
jgi:hypothetical protein